MEHFRVVVELGKKRSESRVLYVRADNIIDAMTVGRKLRGGNPITAHPISYKDYMSGVSKKYDNPPQRG
ncbi:MAG: hypothetical protein H8E12_07770 [Rhodobacteraceae bacterium]|nr:hypothetical protein [Paracoccaceae bacterium]